MSAFPAGSIKGSLVLDKGQFTAPLTQAVGEARGGAEQLRQSLGKPFAPAAQESRKLTAAVAESTAGVGRFAGALRGIQGAAQPLALLPGPFGAMAGRISSLTGMIGQFTSGLGSIGSASGSAGGAVASLGGAAGGAAGSLGSMAAMGGPVGMALGAVAAAAAVATLGIKSLLDVVNQTSDAADALGDAAQGKGLDPVWFDGMGKAAKLAGGDLAMVGDMAKFVNKNVTLAALGNKEAQKTFNILGVSIHDAAGNVRGTEAVTMDLLDALGELPDGAIKSGLAMRVFGRSGDEVVAFANMGSAAINAYIARLKASGAVVTAEQIRQADLWNDTKQAVLESLGGIQLKLAEPIRSALLPWLERLDAWVQANGPQIAAWAASAGDAVVVLFNRGVQAVKPYVEWLQSWWNLLGSIGGYLKSWKQTFDEAFGDGAAGKLASLVQTLSPLNLLLKVGAGYMDAMAAVFKGLAKTLDTIREGIRSVKAYFGGDDFVKDEVAAYERRRAEARAARGQDQPSSSKAAGNKTDGLTDEQRRELLEGEGGGAAGSSAGGGSGPTSADRVRQLQVETQIARLRNEGRQAEADLLALQAKWEERARRAPEGKAGDAERDAVKAGFEQERAALLAKQKADADKANRDAADKAIEASVQARIAQLKAAGDELGADLLERGQRLKKDLAANRTAADPADEASVGLSARLLDDQGKSAEAQQMRDRAAARKAILEAFAADEAAIRQKHADKAKRDREDEVKEHKKRRQDQLDAQADLAVAWLTEEGRQEEADLLRFDAAWQKKIAAAEDAQTRITLNETYQSERRQKVREQEARAAEEGHKRLAGLTEGLASLAGGDRAKAYADVAALAARAAGRVLPPPGTPRPADLAGPYTAPPVAGAGGANSPAGQAAAAQQQQATLLGKLEAAMASIDQRLAQLAVTTFAAIERNTAKPQIAVARMGG